MGVEEYNATYEELRDAMVEYLKRPDQAVTWGVRSAPEQKE